MSPFARNIKPSKKCKTVQIAISLKTKRQCGGALVTCPQRLFPVFDILYDNVWSCKPGTLICTHHLTSADQDKRICGKEQYTPPRKVRNYMPSLPYWHQIDVGNLVNNTFFTDSVRVPQWTVGVLNLKSWKWLKQLKCWKPNRETKKKKTRCC